MYKHAIAIGKSPAERPKKPLPRAYWRQFYYIVIKNELGGFSKHYAKKAPAWLLAELRSFGPEKWLAYWNRKTGKPKHAPYRQKTIKAR